MTTKFAPFLIAGALLAQSPVSNPKANKQMKAWVDPVTDRTLICGDYSYLVYLA